MASSVPRSACLLSLDESEEVESAGFGELHPVMRQTTRSHASRILVRFMFSTYGLVEKTRPNLTIDDGMAGTYCS